VEVIRLKKYKIYGSAYGLTDEAPDAIDSYAVGGELVDDEPTGTLLGYAEMEDGSIVACYKKKSMLMFLPLGLLLIAVAGALVYFLILPMFEKEVAVGGTMLQTDVGTNIVTFNGIMSVSDGTVDVRFVNGNKPATIQIKGDGVVSDTVSVEAGDSVDNIPITVTTDRSVVEVTITVNSDGTNSTFNALVEVPDNNNDYDPESGLNSYFEKEVVVDEQPE